VLAMNDDDVVQNFFNEICCIFPEIKPLMDEQDECMTTSKMEAFADATCAAFANGNIELAKKYLSYVDKKLIDSHPKEFEFIDVYYVEHLFWKASKSTKEIGWPLVPPKLQELYVKFHGTTAI
jgi:hypothetical protein